MNEINCLSDYRGITIWISFICASLVAILAIVITALVISQDTFAIGELWGIVVHRYQVIVFSGIIVYCPAYRAAEFCFYRCCPGLLGLPEKTKDQSGFMFII